jgi:nitroreductase
MGSAFDVIKKRTSVRTHTDKPIRDGDLEKIVEAANWAPSAGNSYPWKLVIVQNRDLLRKIQAVSPGMLGRPTAVIILCIDRERAMQIVGEKGRDLFCIMDISHAAQNICLAATELGIGSCCIMSFNPEAVAELINLPKNICADYIVSLGYPDGAQIKTQKRTLEETVISWIRD